MNTNDTPIRRSYRNTWWWRCNKCRTLRTQFDTATAAEDARNRHLHKHQETSP